MSADFVRRMALGISAGALSVGSLDGLALNWLLLIICAVIVICVLFFLFFWNRLVAWFVALLIRLKYWRSQNVWIECESMQVSLLAGRIFFKDFRYYSRNMSVRVLKCHITWRYWLWRSRDDMSDATATGGEDVNGRGKRISLPCRVFVYVEGVEWFLYNRTPAYDSIVERMCDDYDKTHPTTPEARASSSFREKTAVPSNPESERKGADSTPMQRPSSPVQNMFARSAKPLLWLRDQVPTIAFSEILPIEIHAITGAIVLGNDSTPSLMIASFKSALGTYGVSPSRSALDLHKQVFNAKFTAARIITRTNPDYRSSMLHHGQETYSDAVRDGIISADAGLNPRIFQFFDFRRLATAFRKRKHADAPMPLQNAAPIKVWKGLDRFRTEEERTKGEMRHEAEYAKVPTLLDAPMLEMTYYSDVAGVVPQDPPPLLGAPGLETVDIGNGDMAPEWGVDLIIRNGTLTYGPWADRQRDFIQKVFTPSSYQDAHETPRLKPGDTRLAAAMKFFVQLEGSTTLRIPTREPSKDWKYDGVSGQQDVESDERAYGWLNIITGTTSTINYVLPAITGKNGYDILLDLHLMDVAITSSVNYAKFWSAGSCRILCEMPSPLRWNQARTWAFDVIFVKPQIYLLRDHVNLLTDLVRDWNSGPTHEYAVFVPMTYRISFKLRDYALNLYANDFNVVSKPLSKDDNVFVTLSGATMDSEFSIPSTRYRPEGTEIPFWFEFPNTSGSMTFPLWNTYAAFATPRTTHVATAGVLRIDGSYLYYSNVHPDYVEKLTLNVSANNALFKCFGWVLRHLMVMKDGYFGSCTNFSTLEEFQQKRARNAIGDPIDEKYRPGKSNAFEIDVRANVQDAVVILPQNIYDCVAAVVINVSELDAAIGVHEYSMDLEVLIHPMQLTAVANSEDWIAQRPTIAADSSMEIESFNVTCNRLFGPHPRTATYLCLWEMQVGTVKGSVPIAFTSGLAAAVQSLGYTFKDLHNSPDPELELGVNPDVTFLKVALSPVDLVVQSSKSALHLQVHEGGRFDYTDLPSALYHKTISVVAAVSARALVLSGSSISVWYEAASVSAGLLCELYLAPANWREKAAVQTQFVATQDQLTRRAVFVYAPEQEAARSKVWQRRGPFVLPYGRAVGDADLHWTPTNSNAGPSSAVDDTSHQSDSSNDDELLEDKPRGIASGPRRPSYVTTPSAVYFDAPDGSARGSTSVDSDNEESEHSSATESSDSGYKGSSARLSQGPIRSVLKPYELRRVPGRKASSMLPLEHWGSFPPLIAHYQPVKAASLGTLQGEEQAEGPSSVPSNTTLSLYLSEEVQVLITPCLAQFAEDIYTSTSTFSVTPERELDELMRDHLDISQPALSRLSTTLNIRAPSIAVRSLQLAKVPSLHGDTHRTRIRSGDEAVTTVLTIVDTCIGPSSVALKTLSASSDSPTTISCKSSVASWRTCIWQSNGNEWESSVANSHSILSTMSTAVEFSQTFDLAVQSVEACIGVAPESTTGDLAVGSVQMRLLTASAESPPATAIAVVDAYRPLPAFQQAAQLRTRAQKRFLLWTVLQFSDDRNITTDPAFLNLTTFLVQFGRPGQYRADAAWRIISHVRHCFRLMPMTLRDHLSRVLGTDATMSDPRTEQAVYSEVVGVLNKWRTWEIDISGRSVRALFRSLFVTAPMPDELGQPSLADHLKKPTLLRLRVEEVAVSLVSSADYAGPGNVLLSVGSLSVSLQSCLRRWVGDDAVHDAVLGSMEHAPQDVFALQACLSISTGAIELYLAPDLITVLQRVLRSRRVGQQITSQSRPIRPVSPEAQGKASWLPKEIERVFLNIDASMALVKIQAAAQSITFDFGLKQVACMTTISLDIEQQEISEMPFTTSSTFSFEDLLLQARAVLVPQRNKSTHRALAWVNFGQLSATLAFRRSGGSAGCRAVIASKRICISVPHSALRLYRFVEEWRAEYFPTYDVMLHDLMAELEQDSTPSSTTQRNTRLLMAEVSVQAAIDTVAINLRVLPSTWFSWEFYEPLVFLQKTPSIVEASEAFQYGLNLGSQQIKLVQATASFHEGLPSSSPLIMLDLPSFHMSGDFSPSSIRAVAIVDYFDIRLNAQIMDDVLTIPGKFGKDINDLLDVVSDNRRSRSENRPSRDRRPEEAIDLKYELRLMLRGFEIGIEGPSSIQFIETSKIEGTLSNEAGAGITWEFSISDLALSLAHSTADTSRTKDGRRYRSTHMVVDLTASNHPPARALERGRAAAESISLVIHKVHAVMQAAAIGELGDLIDHYQSEMLLRKEQRASEIETIKAQTQRVLQTFEVEDRPLALHESSSWFATRFIFIEVSRIGLSFPLTFEEVFMPSDGTGVMTSLPVSPAFLFAVDSVSFNSEPNNSGSVCLTALTFQFVSRFDQNDSSHFQSSKHETKNRLSFPEMKVDVRSSTSRRLQSIRLLAMVSGFDLDLDPTIAPYIFSLIDVYQQGKDRLHRLSQPMRDAEPPPSQKPDAPHVTHSDSGSSSPASDIKASFEFKSARVRFYPPVPRDGRAKGGTRRQLPPQLRTGLGIEGVTGLSPDLADPDVFNLPTVSAWCEYAGAVSSSSLAGVPDVQPAALLLNAVVHPSKNSINPSLLPFVLELSRNLERRLQRNPSPSDFVATPTSASMARVTPNAMESFPVAAVESLQINFSLRIDESELEMTCHPHVNVAAGLKWKSGGFVITISPGAKEIGLIATIAGINAGVRHGYLSVNCLDACAQDLTASATLKQIRSVEGMLTNVVSVVVNTQVSGSVRFARLQDLLCFKAVWLDSIPVIESSRRPVTDSEGQKTPNPSDAASRPFVTNVLVQFRNLDLEADLGQSISRVKLGVNSVILRSRLADESSEVSLSVTGVNLSADRTLSGYVHLDSVSFEAALKQRKPGTVEPRFRMLDLRIGLGAMEVALSTDSKKILQFHAEPVRALVYDDWSSITDSPSAAEGQTIRLNFVVDGGTFEAVSTILTVPRLIAIFNRVQLLVAAQRDGAARESEAFRSARSSRPDNALSEVATAIIQSARSKFRDEDDNRSIIILQTMRLQAACIRLAVFPRSTSDQDLVRFEANGVLAELTRNVLEDGRPHRNLDLRLSSFSIRRMQPRQLTLEEIEGMDASRWFELLKAGTEVTLFNGPPTRVTMESWEDDQLMRLDYEFDMTYSALFGSKSAEGSVFLALNYGLLKWLGALAQSFQEEMDKALSKAPTDFADGPATPASPARREAFASPASLTNPSPTSVLLAPSRAPSRASTPPPRPSTPSGQSPTTSPVAQRMTYHKLTPGNIELPQLVQLGDITPRSNQLTLVGLRLDLIPKWVHEAATLPLEGIMKILLQLYSRQLRQMRRES